jgi:putative RecB family exonuclease
MRTFDAERDAGSIPVSAAAAGGTMTGEPGGATASLSPSRAADFMTCPLLFRFRSIDRLPERPSVQAVRGTVVHAVLERLFDLPRSERTLDAALALLGPQWVSLRDAQPELAELFAGEDDLDNWLQSARDLLAGYFVLEDPSRLEPAEREHYVETVLGSGLRLRGYIDRVDRTPTGAVRIVDYKTGRAPGELFEAKALFQMRFYALMLWRLSGAVPSLLQLMYLGNREVLRYAPDEAELRATERKVEALGEAIRRATETGEWRSRRSKLCDWCDHQSRCPEFGGTPPPLPLPYPRQVKTARPDLPVEAESGRRPSARLSS